MATYQFSLVSVCAGGNHVTINVSKNSGANKSFTFERNDVMSAISEDDIKTTVLTLLRLGAEGRTVNQVVTALTNGYTVTL